MRFLSKNGWFFMINGRAIGEKSAVSRTWYLNDTIDCSDLYRFEVGFISNNQYFYEIACYGVPNLEYHSRTTNHKVPYMDGAWNDSAYRAITFDLPPSGDLLTWLQANGIPQ